MDVMGKPNIYALKDKKGIMENVVYVVLVQEV